MEELEQILIKKIAIYKDLYIVADEMNDINNKKYYGRCLTKLRKMIEIL